MLASKIAGAKSANAWKYAAILLGAITIGLCFGLVKVATTQPVALITHDLASGTGKFAVTDDSTQSAPYLGYIAKADVELFANWTSWTVVNQFQRFLNRLNPELVGQQQVSLTAQAKRLSTTNQTQMVLINDDPKVSNKGVITIEGRLKRYDGEVLVMNDPVIYHLSYSWSHGIPYLATFSFEVKQDDKKYDKEEAAAGKTDALTKHEKEGRNPGDSTQEHKQ